MNDEVGAYGGGRTLSRGMSIVLCLAGLILGLGAGAYGGYWYSNSKKTVTEKTACEQTTIETATTTESSSTDEALVTCLKAKWGESKYEAITANPTLASVDDKFNALPCYK